MVDSGGGEPPGEPSGVSQPAQSDDYRVRLDAFEGPLDLLLFLVRRAEVNIRDIPVASITDQYLAHLRSLRDIDVDVAGEFLLMAATLLEIKSRLLAPRPEPEPGSPAPPDDADPRHDLVRHLLAYKACRDAGDWIQQRRAAWWSRLPAAAHRPGLEAHVPDPGACLDELDPMDLVRAYARIAQSVCFDRLGDYEIVADDTPIELHAADLLDRLRTEGSPAPDDARPRLKLVDVFAGRTRAEMIGLFLATLELVRQGAVLVRQEGARGPVVVVLALEPPAAAPLAAASSEQSA
jgi:segregation and condensation protein A